MFQHCSVCIYSILTMSFFGICLAGVFALGHESRKIRYFRVVQKFKVLVFRSGRFGLLPASA